MLKTFDWRMGTLARPNASTGNPPKADHPPTHLTAWAVGLIIGLLPTLIPAEDWPQFRGINASGVSTSKKPLPTEFSLEKNLRWSVKLGDGVGCPIIVGGKAFTTAMTNERTFSVFAFEAATGRKLWQKDFESGKLPRITPPNSHASSTPASDGQRVYVYFSTHGLISLDAQSGEQAWKRSLPSPSYLMDW